MMDKEAAERELSRIGIDLEEFRPERVLYETRLETQEERDSRVNYETAHNETQMIFANETTWEAYNFLKSLSTQQSTKE